MKGRSLWILAGVALAALWLVASTSPPPMEGNGRQFFGLWRTRSLLVAMFLVWGGVAVACAKSGPSVRRRFALLSASALAIWALLEVLGLFLISWPALLDPKVPPQMGMLAIPHLDEKGVTYPDLATSWRLPTSPIPYHFKTDRRGFRNEPDRESADVYCVGDSILVAGLLAWPDTLAARLEGQIRRPVINVALVGISPQAERKLLLDSGLPLSGRLVLHFLFEGNDLRDSATWRSGDAGGEEKLSRFQRTLFHQLVVRLQLITQPQPAYAAAHTGRIGDTEYLFGWLANSFGGLESELTTITDCLTEFRRDVESAGGTYAVVLVPATIRVLGPFCTFPADSDLSDWNRHCGPLPEHLRAWSERTGTRVLDLTPALVESTRAGQIPWFPGDTHWNEIGHRVAAATIAHWTPVKAWAKRRDPR